MTDIIFINHSTVLSDAAVRSALPALQAQVEEDFEPIWKTGLAAKLSFAGAAVGVGDISGAEKYVASAPSPWLMFILDNSDQEGALGYHMDDAGMVYGRVFAKDVMAYGASWTVDCSHELLEMLADPTTAVMCDLQGKFAGMQCLQEVCDAVEDETCAYHKRGVLVSDFVTPAYFRPGQPNDVGFDFMKKLSAPAPALMPGGYLGIFDPASSQWSQVTAMHGDGSQSYRSCRFGRANRAAKKR